MFVSFTILYKWFMCIDLFPLFCFDLNEWILLKFIFITWRYRIFLLSTFHPRFWWHHFRDIPQNIAYSSAKRKNILCCRYDFGRRNLNNMTWWSRFFNIPNDDDVCSIRFFLSFISNFIQEVSGINAIVLLIAFPNFRHSTHSFDSFITRNSYLCHFQLVCSCVRSNAFQFLCLLFINDTN